MIQVLHWVQRFQSGLVADSLQLQGGRIRSDSCTKLAEILVGSVSPGSLACSTSALLESQPLQACQQARNMYCSFSQWKLLQAVLCKFFCVCLGLYVCVE